MNAFSPLEPKLDAGQFPGQQPRLPRKNLLLSATIESGGLKAPVRIRNLSQSGAMLDGAALPDTGARLVLRRSSITIGAAVVWRTTGRCGIHFERSSITVEEWVAGEQAASFAGYQGQARVDAIQDAVRTGSAPLVEKPAPSGGTLSAADLESRIVEELSHARQLLDNLGEELVDNPVVLQQHMRALQNLDRACQVLEHLGTILGASDRVAAAKAVVMQDLRARLLREPDC